MDLPLINNNSIFIMAQTKIKIPSLVDYESGYGAYSPPFNVDYLVVAGGGGAGWGGGGAGGLRTSYGSNSGGGNSAENAAAIALGNSYQITVG